MMDFAWIVDLMLTVEKVRRKGAMLAFLGAVVTMDISSILVFFVINLNGNTHRV